MFFTLLLLHSLDRNVANFGINFDFRFLEFRFCFMNGLWLVSFITVSLLIAIFSSLFVVYFDVTVYFVLSVFF